MHWYTCINALAQGISRPNSENCTGGGGTLIFHIGLDHFWGFKIFGVFRKMNIFLWYEDFVDIGGGDVITKWLVLGVISMHFRVFS